MGSVGLLRAQAGWDERPEDAVQIRGLFQLPASDVERGNLEESVVLRCAEVDEEEGDDQKQDQHRGEDELFRGEVAQHRELVEDQRCHNAVEHVGPHPPVALVRRNKNFESLLMRTRGQSFAMFLKNKRTI